MTFSRSPENNTPLITDENTTFPNPEGTSEDVIEELSIYGENYQEVLEASFYSARKQDIFGVQCLLVSLTVPTLFKFSGLNPKADTCVPMKITGSSSCQNHEPNHIYLTPSGDLLLVSIVAVLIRGLSRLDRSYSNKLAELKTRITDPISIAHTPEELTIKDKFLALKNVLIR
jgi:hypothetical protein